jgi:hypothetical protein
VLHTFGLGFRGGVRIIADEWLDQCREIRPYHAQRKQLLAHKGEQLVAGYPLRRGNVYSTAKIKRLLDREIRLLAVNSNQHASSTALTGTLSDVLFHVDAEKLVKDMLRAGDTNG